MSEAGADEKVVGDGVSAYIGMYAEVCTVVGLVCTVLRRVVCSYI